MEKKIRIFLNENLNEQSEIILSKDQSHYLSSVMRLKVGQKVLFFNGNDGEFYGIINLIEKKKTTIKILSKEREVNDKQKVVKVVLAFCPPKGNKLDFLIQKSTEIGVKDFVPVISDHTINRKINIDRLKKIIIESAEQSNQIQLPNLQNPLSFNSFVNNFSKSTILFADINSLNNSLEKIIEKKQSNYIKKKKLSQPNQIKTCGSTFKNISEEKKAWMLIKQSGCENLKEGDALISKKHCNFFVNNGNAKASDIEKLIEKVKKRVFEKTGVNLELEIKIIGD